MNLTRLPQAINPRACDCDFCAKHGARYVSDPDGWLQVQIRDDRLTRRYRQGDKLAEFLLCGGCGVLVGVFYHSERGLHATINAKALNGGVGFGAELVVSPRKLAPAERAGRWMELWFKEVSVVNEKRTPPSKRASRSESGE